jgi:hypothetical protein
LAPEIVSVLSQMTHSKIRLFLVAPHGRKPIFGGQIEKVCAILTMRSEIANVICYHQTTAVAPALEWSHGHVPLFSEI